LFLLNQATMKQLLMLLRSSLKSRYLLPLGSCLLNKRRSMLKRRSRRK